MVNFAYDFTGDGWPDILMVDQRPIYLYVNPRGESRRWDRYNVVPQASTEIELMKDIDGDGKPEILFGGDGAMEYAKPDPADPTNAVDRAQDFGESQRRRAREWGSAISITATGGMDVVRDRVAGGSSPLRVPRRRPGHFMRHPSGAAARRWAFTM